MVDRDYLPTSPVAALQGLHGDKTRERVLSPWELEIIWQKSFGVGAFGYVIRLCIILGTRKGETIAIQSDWIKDRTLVIPAQFAKNRTEHVPAFD